MPGPNMDDYAEVPERIAAFHKKYPAGSLQATWEIREFPNKDGKVQPHFVVTGYAYRTPDDVKPGMGVATEPVPGLTQFTRGSELSNGETSAWGRALVAVGFAASRKIASAEEVRNRQGATDPAPEKKPAPPTITDAQATRLSAALGKLGVTLEDSLVRLQSYGVEKYQDLSPEQAKDMAQFFRDRRTPVAS